MQPQDSGGFDWVAPPSGDDPKAQAEYFMTFLDRLAQQGSTEAKRIRSALVQVVSDYANAADKALAKSELRARLAGLEVGVYELVLKNVRKIRDRYIHESRKLGGGASTAVYVRTAADGFTFMVDALDKLYIAARDGRQELRAESSRLLEKAKAALGSLPQS